MEIRPVDKIMLVMLSEIYDALKIKGEIDTEFLREALFGGHSWAIEREMHGLTSASETPTEAVKQVYDILDMHRVVEPSFRKLALAEKGKVTNPDDLDFAGFDGNNETEHFSAATFMIEKMGLYAEFKGRPLNSHRPTVGKALRQVRVFQRLRAAKGLTAHGGFTGDELNEIANA